MRPTAFAAFAVLAAARLCAADADFCIAGTVVNALTGEPIRRAAVTIPQAATLTDAAGAFGFCGLAAGWYYANGEKPGFVANGERIAVGPSREDVRLRLQPLAVIKGKVTDADGEALENVLVQLLSLLVRDGRRQARVESAVATDDRGEYRLPGLLPGRYVLRVAGGQCGASTENANSNQAFAPVYYSGATSVPSAAPLAVEAGQERTADFAVTPAASYHIRGTVTGYSAAIPAKIELLRADDDLSAAPVVLNSATGAFHVDQVVPGSYVLRVTQGEDSQRLRGEQAVQVSRSDVAGVVLTLSAPVAVKGAVHVADASTQTPAPPNCSIKLSPAGVSISTDDEPEAATSAEGSFELTGVLPGRYRVRMDCANGYIASARFGDADLLALEEIVISPGVTPSPLDAVLGTDGATLDATPVQTIEGVTPWLLLFPDSGSELHTRLARFAGKVSLTGIAPGDYQAFVWTGSPAEFEYAVSAVRQSWANHAVSVHLAARDHQSITLKVPPESK